MTEQIKSRAHKMSPHEKHVIEFGVLILGAIILFLWLQNQNQDVQTPAAITPAGNTGPGQPVNLNFQTPPINVTLAGGYESGLVPLFGFIGQGIFS